MSKAKVIAKPPDFDATSFLKFLNDMGTEVLGKTLDPHFVNWKRWVEATAAYDGAGLSDVVNTNAAVLRELETRVALLEAKPTLPFPLGSGQP